MNASDAAQHLVDRELSRFTGLEPHAVDVAAAMFVERVRPRSIEPRITDLLGRGEAVSFAVGAMLCRPDERDLVERSWNALDPRQQGFAANALGELLAGVDIRWAWSLVAPVYADNGSGIRVALLAELANLAPAMDARFAANVAALHVLRDAVSDPSRVRDAVVERCDDVFSVEHSFVSRLFVLAACAIVDPVAALDTVERHELWLEYGEAIELIARELHARGQHAAWLATMRPDDPYYKRAAWLGIATGAHLLVGTEAHALVVDAFEDVYRDAAADEEVTECYPLLSAFVELDRAVELVDAADRVRMPPGMLADLLFWTGNERVATAASDAGAFERLCARPSEQWGGGRSGWGPSWWHDALDSRTVLATSKAVAALAGHTPWQRPPDGLEAFVELVRTVAHPAGV